MMTTNANATATTYHHPRQPPLPPLRLRFRLLPILFVLCVVGAKIVRGDNNYYPVASSSSSQSAANDVSCFDKSRISSHSRSSRDDDLPKFVLKARSGSELQYQVQRNNIENSLKIFSISVINGTIHLHLGGHYNEFHLMLGDPPQTSSDIELTQAIKTIRKAHPDNYIILRSQDDMLLSTLNTMVDGNEDFLTMSEENTSTSKSSNIWTSQHLSNLLHGVDEAHEIHTNSTRCSNGANLNIDLTNYKQYSQDSVIDRLKRENHIAVKPEFDRIIHILGRVYSSHMFSTTDGGKVSTEDVKFLSTQIRRLERSSWRRRGITVEQSRNLHFIFKTLERKSHSSSFTQLFVSSLHQLAELAVNGKLSHSTLKNFMKDVQAKDVRYDEQDGINLRQVLDSRSSKECCVITFVTLRLGVWANSAMSLNTILDVMKDYQNTVFIAYAKPYDSAFVENINTISNFYKQEHELRMRIFFELPISNPTQFYESEMVKLQDAEKVIVARSVMSSFSAEQQQTNASSSAISLVISRKMSFIAIQSISSFFILFSSLKIVEL